jgi:hypothetical protein
MNKWNWADTWHVTVTGTIALLLVLATCYMAIQQIPIPELLSGALWMALGYFFGAQTQKFTNSRNNAAKARAAAAKE